MPCPHSLRSIYGISLASLGGLMASGLMPPMSTPAHAQSIVEATDGTGTIVQIDNNIFSISGGTLSANDQNLFHSFQSFNLKSQETANFLSDTQVQNILGRVTGEAASIINGTLQVTGSDANLFLMNPAGFIFGADAQLNVPGDFTATTATGIGFEDRWFNATGDNDYEALTNNTPTQFAFATDQPGSIFNEGTLAVDEGQTLTLMGRSVLNTGTLEAPNGLVMMTAVPGEQVVQISRDDMILTLAIEPLNGVSSGGTDNGSGPIALNYTPSTLSQLLTGGQNNGHATSVEVKSDGSIVLTDADTTIDAGWAMATTDPSVVTLPDANAASATTLTIQTNTPASISITEVTAASFVAPTETQGAVAYSSTLPAVQSSSNPSTDNNNTDNTGVNDVDMDLPDASILDNSDPDVNSVDDTLDVLDPSTNSELDTDSTLSPLSSALPSSNDPADPSTSALPNSNAAPSPSTGTLPNSNAAPAPSAGALPNSNTAPAPSAGALPNSSAAPAPSAGALPNSNASPTIVSGTLSAVGSPADPSASALPNANASPGPVAGALPNSNVGLPQNSDDPAPGTQTTNGGTITQDIGNDSSGPLESTITIDAGPSTLDTNTNPDPQSSTPVGTAPGGTNTPTQTSTPDTTSIQADATGLDQIDGGNDIDSGTPATTDTDIVNPDSSSTGNIVTPVSSDSTNTLGDHDSSSESSGIEEGSTVALANSTATLADGTDTTIDESKVGFDQDTNPDVGPDTTGEPSVELTLPNTADSLDSNLDDKDTTVDVVGPETLVPDSLDPDTADSDTADSDTPNSHANALEPLDADIDSVAIAPESLPDSVVAGIKIPDDAGSEAEASTSVSSTAPLTDHSTSPPPATAPATATDSTPSAAATPSSPSATPSTSPSPTAATSASSTSPSPSTNASVESGENASEASASSESSATSSVEGASINEADSSAEGESSTEGNSDRIGVPQYAFPHNGVNVAIGEAGAAIASLEQQRNDDLVSYFGRDLDVADVTPETVQNLLRHVNQQTGNRAAIVYITAPQTLPYLTLKPDQTSSDVAYADDDAERSALHPEVLKQAAWKQDFLAPNVETPLELLVFTLEGEPLRIQVPGVSREHLFATITQFRNDLVLSERRGTDHYLPTSQRLYQWLMAPLEAELGSDAVETFLFAMDSGLRGLPIAALHDGDKFVVEKYSVGMVPSLGVMNSQYTALANADVLAMGAETFTQQDPLPAVPVEVNTITEMQGGRAFLNEAFTQHNLIYQQTNQPSQIIHLATHASFNPGTAEDSYIQLWGDEQLSLSEVQTLGWNNPAVDLLVLSACQTAVGNAQAEMGFAGLAVAAGVQSALASLWTINDEGTLALMTEFYDHLNAVSLKSEALRQSQLAMLNGTIHIEDGHLVRGEEEGRISLPSSLELGGDRDLSHPYYWSGFTMIGSPW